jgi:HTH-type transcriptional regulator/antitoxin HipB
MKIRQSQELGHLVRDLRVSQQLRQSDLAGLANTGTRFMVELEQGKPTLQLQKVLDVLDLLGLEVIIRRKGAQ